MGRLLKKKDAGKKKAQRLDKAGDAVQTDAGEGTSAPRLAPVVKKPQMAAKPRAVTGAEDNFLRKSIQFLREVKTELKKVTWPSRKQAMGSTLVVIILVMIISLFLGAVDFSLSSLVRIVLP
jgi:preprotein translocase subunit SecE